MGRAAMGSRARHTSPISRCGMTMVLWLAIVSVVFLWGNAGKINLKTLLEFLGFLFKYAFLQWETLL